MQNAHNIMTGPSMRLRLPVHRKALTDAFLGASHGSWWYMRGVMVSLLMREFISTDSYCWEPRLSQDTASDLMTPGAGHQGGWLDYLIWNLPYVTAELSMSLFALWQLKPGVDKCGRFKAERQIKQSNKTVNIKSSEMWRPVSWPFPAIVRIQTAAFKQCQSQKLRKS